VEDGLNTNTTVMCSSGAHYIDEEHYERELNKKKFYSKQDDKWDYYSGLPNPSYYMERSTD
jgi:hypothetical protein